MRPTGTNTTTKVGRAYWGKFYIHVSFLSSVKALLKC